MHSEKIFDVVIVGSGVAGSSCARILVKHGINALVIEKKKLPRVKPCSGVLSPRAWRYVKENFGEIPLKCFSEPHFIKGVNFCFPDGRELPIPFKESSAPQVWRKDFDYWLLSQSKCAFYDETSLRTFREENDHVLVYCDSRGRESALKCRYLVGADGPFSETVNQLYPGFRKVFPYFLVAQYFYEAHMNLSPEFFHLFIDANLGLFSWANKKDRFWNIGCSLREAGKFRQLQEKVLDFLQRKHDLKIHSTLHCEGCLENGGMSALNEYLLGKGRILVTGQAAGFLDIAGEGMTPSIFSAMHAANSIVHAFEIGCEPLPLYEAFAMEEKVHCSDQWNPLQLILGTPLEADVKKALFSKPLSEALWMIGKIVKYVKVYRKLGWGWKNLKVGLKRLITGKY